MRRLGLLLLPVRVGVVRYTVALRSLQGRNRSIVATDDYRVWGEPVDVTP